MTRVVVGRGDGRREALRLLALLGDGVAVLAFDRGEGFLRSLLREPREPLRLERRLLRLSPTRVRVSFSRQSIEGSRFLSFRYIWETMDLETRPNVSTLVSTTLSTFVTEF